MASTVAAAASATMPTAVLVATLEKVSKKPSLFFARELPQPVEWAIADDYQRGDEPPGTHWRDVWGDQVATFPGEVEQPTDLNIAKAADAAIATIQKTRKAGRTYNRADQILAVRLGAIFRRSGRPIRRRREPVMRRGEAVYVEGGSGLWFSRTRFEAAASIPPRTRTGAGDHRDNRTPDNCRFSEG
jgi:hypothetical protein